MNHIPLPTERISQNKTLAATNVSYAPRENAVVPQARYQACSRRSPPCSPPPRTRPMKRCVLLDQRSAKFPASATYPLAGSGRHHFLNEAASNLCRYGSQSLHDTVPVSS